MDVYFSLFVAFLVWLLLRYLPSLVGYIKTIRAVKDIHHDEAHWLLGHLLKIQPNQSSMIYLLDQVKKFPKVTLLLFGPILFFLSLHHPDVVRPLLNTEEPKDDIVYRFMRPWIGDGLLTSSGKKWKRNRRLLTPSFHFESLRRYLLCMNNSANELLNKWEGKGENSIKIEMFANMSLMTLDNLLRCIFSKRTNCQAGGESEYLDAVRQLTGLAMKRLHNVFHQIDFIFYLTNSGRTYKKALKVAHNYTERAVTEREKRYKFDGTDQGVDRDLDFLDMLLLAKDENGIGLTHREICDEVDTFVFEGHDTVTSALSWSFYNLAKYPEWQNKCRDEAREIIGERNTVNWEDLSKFSILTMFIKESMRIYPPVFSIARKTANPVFFPRGFGSDQLNLDRTQATADASRTIPEKMLVGVNIFMLHHHPEIWENPEEFDPLRFTTENIAKRQHYSYLPFSSGPRNCIGQNFAMNELKVVLALALLKFKFSTDKLHPEPEMQPHVVLRAKNGIHLVAEKI